MTLTLRCIINYIISICTRYRDITAQGSRNYIKSVCVKLSKRRYGNYKLIDSWIFLQANKILIYLILLIISWGFEIKNDFIVDEEFHYILTPKVSYIRNTMPHRQKGILKRPFIMQNVIINIYKSYVACRISRIMSIYLCCWGHRLFLIELIYILPMRAVSRRWLYWWVIFNDTSLFVMKLFVRSCARVGILLACGKHVHDRIISLKSQIWAHKTSLTSSLFIKVSVPSQKHELVVYMCYGYEVRVPSQKHELVMYMCYGYRTKPETWAGRVYVLRVRSACTKPETW
jgi:hypothetical protein